MLNNKGGRFTFIDDKVLRKNLNQVFDDIVELTSIMKNLGKPLQVNLRRAAILYTAAIVEALLHYAVVASDRTYNDPEGVFNLLYPDKNYSQEIDDIRIQKSDLFEMINDILGLREIFDVREPLATLGIVEDFSDMHSGINRDSAFTIYYRLRQLNYFLRFEFDSLGFSSLRGDIYFEGRFMGQADAREKFRDLLIEKYGSLANIRKVLALVANDLVSDYWIEWNKFLGLQTDPFPEINRIIFSTEDPIVILEGLKNVLD